MKLKYLGHSTFQLFTGGATIIVDPFITGNPLAGDVSVDALEADFILVTHGHGDHVADVAAIAGRTGASIISNFEIVDYQSIRFRRQIDIHSTIERQVDNQMRFHERYYELSTRQTLQ